MRWILAGCCGLALITLTVSLQVLQKPRFYGVKTNRHVSIFCSSKPNNQSEALWYKVEKETGTKNMIKKGDRIHKGDRIVFRNNNIIKDGILDLLHVTVQDSGVYFCEINGVQGPGSELKAVRHVNLKEAQYRSNMKDGLIVLQGLLLAACIAATLLRKHTLMERQDSVYEEPETDHIYEGLAIETCGGGLYEDLTLYARAEGTEAPWE